MNHIYALLPSLDATELAQLHSHISQIIAEHAATKKDFITELPTELALLIFRFVSYGDDNGIQSLCKTQQVCRRWNELANDEGLWRCCCMDWAFALPCDNTPIGGWKGRFLRAWSIRRNWKTGGRLCSTYRLADLPYYASEFTTSPWTTPTSRTPPPPDPTITCHTMSSSYTIVGLSSGLVHVFSTPTGQYLRSLPHSVPSGQVSLNSQRGVWALWSVMRGGSDDWDIWGDDVPQPAKKRSPYTRRLLGLDSEAKPRRQPRTTRNYLNPPSKERHHSPGFGNTEELVVSAGCDRVVKVWNVATGDLLHTFSGHTSTIRAISVLPSSPLCVTASRDGTLRTYDIQRGLPVHILRGHTDAVRCLDWAGERVCSGGYDGTIKLWSLRTGACLRTLLPDATPILGVHHQIYSIAFDGVHIVSGSMNACIYIWNAQDGQCMAQLIGHFSLVSALNILSPTAWRVPDDWEARDHLDTDIDEHVPIDFDWEVFNGLHSQLYPVLVSASSTGSILTHALSPHYNYGILSANESAHMDDTVTSVQCDWERVVSAGHDGCVKVWSWRDTQARGLKESWEVGFSVGEKNPSRLAPLLHLTGARVGMGTGRTGRTGPRISGGDANRTEGVWIIGFLSSLRGLGRVDEYIGSQSENPLETDEGGILTVMSKRGGYSVVDFWTMKPAS